MNNTYHQTIEDILRAATPEQKILWNDIFLRFGQNCAISQLRLHGTNIIGSELSTFVARKIFVAYQLDVDGMGITTVNAYLNITDENNVAVRSINSAFPVWDTTAAVIKYSPVHKQLNNFFFGRVSATTGHSFNFIGYRVTY